MGVASGGVWGWTSGLMCGTSGMGLGVTNLPTLGGGAEGWCRCYALIASRQAPTWGRSVYYFVGASLLAIGRLEAPYRLRSSSHREA